MVNSLLLVLGLTGLVIVSVLYVQPRWLLSIATVIVPGVVYFAKITKPIIALTIDDGPDAATTPKILEILRQHEARATFFIISSRIKGNELLIQEMVDYGHELGNHLTEDKPSIKLSPQEFEVELLSAHAALSKFANTRWLRPASGWHNAKMVKIARKHGYQVVLGSIFPFDTHITSSSFAEKHILFNVYPGAVVVLHDHGLWGQNTASTLERILPQLYRRGYRVVTLSELFAA
jgi:peptidoglycan/xylan/chitin deacetylase (PgdA/CDA1 family)